MSETIIIALIGLFAGGGVWTFLSQLLARKDSKDTNKENLDKFMLRTEIDNVRCQILIMLNHYPNEIQAIMDLGEHYFADLDGDWYMTSLFGKWLKEKDIEMPIWYLEKLKRENKIKGE